MTEEETKEKAKELMAEVYRDGFNIYKCLNKLKKDLKLVPDFPPEAIIWTCEAYKLQKPNVREHWAWFVRVFSANSAKYFAEQHVKESETYDKRGGFAQSIKDILKGM